MKVMSMLREISLIGLVISILLIFYEYTIWLQEMGKSGTFDFNFIYVVAGLGLLSAILYLISSKKV
jgi:hypothetical protein